MRCTKTMVWLAGGFAVVAATAYFTLPQMRDWVLASLPVLIVLLCPLSMLFMMKSMHGANNSKEAAPARGDEPAASGAAQSHRPEAQL